MEEKAVVEKAQSIWASDDLEIDDNAQVSQTGDKQGYWVQAWVFVDAKTDTEG
jgi:hypothetical protein